MAYSNTTLNNYLEAEVLNADPVKLISLLYRGAGEAVGAARRHLADGDIPARSAKIMKAWEILAELLTSLAVPAQETPASPEKESPAQTAEFAAADPQAQELVMQLHDLYGYMQQRLLDANAQQSDEPLAEVASLLTTLAEAWNGLAANPQVAIELATAREARRAAGGPARITPVSRGTAPAGISSGETEPAGYGDRRYHLSPVAL